MKLLEIKDPDETRRLRELKEWVIAHTSGKSDTYAHEFSLEDGEIIYNDTYIRLRFTDGEPPDSRVIPVNFRFLRPKTVEFDIDGPFKSFTNFPVARANSFTGCEFTNLAGLQTYEPGGNYQFIGCKRLKDISALAKSGHPVNYLQLNGCHGLTSDVIAQLPNRVTNLTIIDCPGIDSLSGIHKKEIGTIRLGGSIRRSILGLVLMDVNVPSNVFKEGPESEKLMHALIIVKKHKGKGRAGVIAAQQEMLDAGLDDYAQL